MKKRILGVAFGAILLAGGFSLNTQDAEARRQHIGGPASTYETAMCTVSEGGVIGSMCAFPVEGPCIRKSNCN